MAWLWGPNLLPERIGQPCCQRQPHLEGTPMRTIILVLLALIGCKKNSTVEPPASKAFEYNAYDTTGVLVASGWFTMDFFDSAHVAGEWHLAAVHNPHNIGPQSGSGHLNGGFFQGSLLVNLNPDYVDNNVVLSGQFNGNA